MKIYQSLLYCIITIFFIQCYSAEFHDSTKNVVEQYQCTPCGSECDKATFDEPGKCPDCKMDLVKSSTIQFTTIQPFELCRYISQHPDVVLLDVRTVEEFNGNAKPGYGRIKNAINIPIQELEKNPSIIDSLKNNDIIVYCSHSRRSPRASYILNQQGFKNVKNLAGGMSVFTDKSCQQ